MALSATTVWEVRTDGSDTNGGGYKSDAGTTDYSQQASAQLTVTDAACAGNTTLTSVTGGFTAAMVGNILYLAGEWYELVTYVNTNQVNIDRNGPSDTGMTCNVGGALATPGGAGAVLDAHGVAGMNVWIKAGTYNNSSVGSNVSGGVVDLSTTMASKRCRFEGYQTTRGDRGTKPYISCNGNTPTSARMFNLKGTSGGNHFIINLHLDGDNLQTDCILGAARYYDNVCECEIENCDLNYVTCYCTVYNSYIHDCDANGTYQCTCLMTWIDNCGATGFYLDYGDTNCISSNNGSSGYSVYGPVYNCVSYNNGNNGIHQQRDGRCANNISINNGAYGYIIQVGGELTNCASYNNTSGRMGVGYDYNSIVLTADPYIDAANGDFRLNNAAGGGALCRNAGVGVSGQTDTPDIGAISARGPFLPRPTQIGL